MGSTPIGRELTDETSSLILTKFKTILDPLILPKPTLPEIIFCLYAPRLLVIESGSIANCDVP